jgi:hypothetical protein
MNQLINVVVIAGLLWSVPSAQSATVDQAALVAAAQQIAIAAVTFREGDAPGFTRARSNFTSDGWNAFLKHMEGFLDQRGAPTFTSSFVALQDARFLSEKDGVVVLRIPGTLTQTNKLGRAVYKGALEVHAIRDADSGGSVKIQHLEQITCAGTSSACQ